jgi:hypothetical protein
MGLLHREMASISAAYLADLLPALPACEPPLCVFLSVEAIRKNMDTALPSRNDKFVSTVVCYA